MSTLKDVAKLAGVSTSTVSRTLSNRIFVEEETRQKVLRAVEELGYRPNILARALKEGRTYTIAFLVPDINSLFYPQIMKSIEEQVSSRGYSVILCNNNEDIEREKQTLSMLAARGVDGILCMSVSDDIDHLLRFQQENGIPVVLVNRDGHGKLSSVSMDNENGSYIMTQHLLKNGHTKIAGVFGRFHNSRFRMRHKGCCSAMAKAGITDYDRYFIYDADSPEEAYQKVSLLLAEDDRPTAFFASMDILAMGVYRAVFEKGLRIPEDISVVGFDNIDMTQYMMPPLTTYATEIDKLAKHSVQYLLEQMETPVFRAEEIVGGRVVMRNSVISR